MDIDKSNNMNIVLDTTGEYRDFNYTKNKAIGYYSFKSIDEVNLTNITRYKVVICDLSSIKKEQLKNATELLINKISMITNRVVRITIDTISDYDVCSNLNDILKSYIKANDSIKFTVIAIDSYGLYDIPNDFDTNIVFGISPFTR